MHSSISYLLISLLLSPDFEWQHIERGAAESSLFEVEVEGAGWMAGWILCLKYDLPGSSRRMEAADPPWTLGPTWSQGVEGRSSSRSVTFSRRLF